MSGILMIHRKLMWMGERQHAGAPTESQSRLLAQLTQRRRERILALALSERVRMLSMWPPGQHTVPPCLIFLLLRCTST